MLKKQNFFLILLTDNDLVTTSRNLGRAPRSSNHIEFLLLSGLMIEIEVTPQRSRGLSQFQAFPTKWGIAGSSAFAEDDGGLISAA